MELSKRKVLALVAAACLTGLLSGCGLLEIFGEAFISGTGLVWYVAPDGDDGTAESPNDCRAEATPCLKINNAIRLADPGGTVHLAPGRYVEFYTGSTTTIYIDKPLTLQGSGAENTFIQVHDSWTGVTAVSEEEIIIEGVTIEGGGPDGPSYGALLSGPVILRDSVVRNNHGGGIDANNGARVENVEVFGNEAFGIYVHGSGAPVVITGSIIAETRGFGVQVAAESVASIFETTIRGNQFPSSVAIANAGFMIVNRATINGNRATNWCGSVIGNHGRMTIQNSTISSNQSACAAVANFADLELIHTTVANNESSGLEMQSGESRLLLRNSLIANNGGNDCSIVVLESSSIFIEGTNLDSDQSCLRHFSSDRSEVEILLDPLADNGGPTLTHALPAGSIAIDAAEDGCLEVDQRGVARPVGAACDVGAFEAEILTGAEIVVPIAGEAPPGFPYGPLNCRSGPGVAYDSRGFFDVGDELTILTRNPEATWLEVQGSNLPPCWVNRELLDLDPEFDWMSLPPGKIQPTPTWTPLAPTEEPNAGPLGCKISDGNNNVTCYPIDQCPVAFELSLGACTP